MNTQQCSTEGELPQSDHDHNEQETCSGTLLHHACAFEHQEHERQNRGPALCLPVQFSTEISIHVRNQLG